MAKFIISVILILISVYFTEHAQFLSEKHINKINTIAKTWKVKTTFLFFALCTFACLYVFYSNIKGYQEVGIALLGLYSLNCR